MSSFPAPGPLPGRREPDYHSERVLKELVYVALGLPLGLLYTALIAGGFLLGAVLGVLWIGLPLLLAGSTALWRCAKLERTLANRLLGARIPPLPPLRTDRERSAWQRVRQRLSGGPFWRAFSLLALKLPVTGLAAFGIAIGIALLGLLLVLGVRGVTGAQDGFVGPFRLGPVLGVALCLLAVPVAILTAAVADAAAFSLRALARALLVTSLAAGTPVRERLAASLGDHTLSIAYWLSDRNMFVDERGRPVPLPEAGSDRAWTAVDYGGRRVAAIIHDASIDASRELVQAAAAAASLALDNEQLKADLRARVEELRASRVRIVEASNSARRKLERDLHDGAQQQLVALAIELRLLRGRVGANPEASEMIDRIDEKLSAALADLRELARGIHPAILSDRGLEPALSALAERAPLDVTCECELPVRPPAPVEAAAYFVIAEALTNVLKYAHASLATIRARQEGGDIVVECQDDGVGGADERGGSGLLGLGDRVGALDGTFSVISPPGAGTRVRARIPFRAAELVAEAAAGPSEGGAKASERTPPDAAEAPGTDSRTA
ncbi:MAG: sensor histidine kinase [Solirubrobacteraceae bacterium]